MTWQGAGSLLCSMPWSSPNILRGLLSLQACHGSSERVGGSDLGSAALAAEPAAASAALGACITSPPLLYHCQVRCLVLPWCGFFPRQSLVDSFHLAAQCRRVWFALEWILSAQVSVRPSVTGSDTNGATSQQLQLKR